MERERIENLCYNKRMTNENKLIVANWKMNPKTNKEAENIFKNISNSSKKLKKIKLVICPPYPFLYIKKKIKIKNNIVKIGTQDVFFEKEGSFTGEVSLNMLKDFNVEYVIVGHSERRSRGETNDLINKKIISILKAKVSPILCVGETKRDSNGFYLSFIKDQILNSLNNINKNQLHNIIIAYEPVWAIGENSTREATVSEFIEIKIFIKKVISDIYDIKTANNIRIIYGGSVDEKNSQLFLNEGGADGVLIGRISLNLNKFNTIIINASK